VLAGLKKYYDANREKLREYARDYYWQNRESLKARNRAYYHTHGFAQQTRVAQQRRGLHKKRTGHAGLFGDGEIFRRPL
jgi:hypothetical protein